MHVCMNVCVCVCVCVQCDFFLMTLSYHGRLEARGLRRYEAEGSHRGIKTVKETNCHGEKLSKGANWHLFPITSVSSKDNLA